MPRDSADVGGCIARRFISFRPVSPDIGAAPAPVSLIPFHSGGRCEAVIMAAGIEWAPE